MDTVGSKMLMSVTSMPAGSRNSAGRRNAMTNGANTRMLNPNAVFILVIVNQIEIIEVAAAHRPAATGENKALYKNKSVTFCSGVYLADH